jgi:hypothetical protein
MRSEDEARLVVLNGGPFAGAIELWEPSSLAAHNLRRRMIHLDYRLTAEIDPVTGQFIARYCGPVPDSSDLRHR